MRIEKTAAVLLGFSLFASSSGLTSAYLTSRPRAVYNVVTTGNVEIDLSEPAWREEDADGLTPGSAVPKNPTVTNTGENAAWIFLRVLVPQRTISVVDAQTKRKTAPVKTELFTFEAKDGWELIGRAEKGSGIQYVYGCRTLIAPGEKTAPLFERVTLVNYLEGELTDEDVLQMPVEAVAIQDKVCPAGAALRDIYEIYLKEEAENG